MLVGLLRAEGLEADVLSADAFVGESVEQVAAIAPTLVCVSSLPPYALLHARAMCKKLRATVGDIPIAVGLWGAPPGERYEIGELGRAGATDVVVSLREAVQTACSRALLARHADGRLRRHDAPVIHGAARQTSA
jgi:hypothetical protein